MRMTAAQKERIDQLSYTEMVRIWTFAPNGNPMFPGSAGKYFDESMRRKGRDASIVNKN